MSLFHKCLSKILLNLSSTPILMLAFRARWGFKLLFLSTKIAVAPSSEKNEFVLIILVLFILFYDCLEIGKNAKYLHSRAPCYGVISLQRSRLKWKPEVLFSDKWVSSELHIYYILSNQRLKSVKSFEYLVYKNSNK